MCYATPVYKHSQAKLAALPEQTGVTPWLDVLAAKCAGVGTWSAIFQGVGLYHCA